MKRTLGQRSLDRLYVTGILAVLILSGCRTDRTPRELVAHVGSDKLVTEATWALAKFVSEYKAAPGELPSRFWGKSIRELDPVRVYNHRFNLVVVLESSATEERGVYISAIQSSYAPRDGDDKFSFEPIDGGVYSFVRVK